jgi:hypothetical protein
MKKLYLILFCFLFLSSCIAENQSGNKRRSTYSFGWEDKDFSIGLEKGYSTLDMCPFELTLKNLNPKSYSSVYLEFIAYDESQVNIGYTNFLVSIAANETLKRESYITKSCYFIRNIKLSKFTFR